MLSVIMRLDNSFDHTFRGPNFRYIRSSADVLDPELWRAFENRFGVQIANAYGMSETVCEVIYCGPDPATKRIGSVGKPIDCDIRIVSPSGVDAPDGEIGELQVRGANIMTGYFRRPQETAAVLEDGWLKTGDLVRLDRDGFVTLTGRKKTVIIRGGATIHPEEITGAIRSLTGVRDAVTIGMEHPEWGEIPVSCIVLESGQDLEVADVLAHCRAVLPPEKIPGSVHFVQTLPRSPAGKADLKAIRNIVRDLQNRPKNPARDVSQLVLDTAATIFNVPVSTLKLESTPHDTNGWDSLAHLNLVTALEAHFDFQFLPQEIVGIHSLADARRNVEARLGTGSAPEP